MLERLAGDAIRWEGRSTRLLDEVDIINSVSGGSMTAAYFALHGDRLFRDFDRRFFSPKLQDRLESRILAASAIPRLASLRPHRHGRGVPGRGAVVDVPINRYSYETQTFARQSVEAWHRRMREAGNPLDLYLSST